MQDTLSIKEIDSAFTAVLNKQHLGISYTIMQRSSGVNEFPSTENEITIGFCKTCYIQDGT